MNFRKKTENSEKRAGRSRRKVSGKFSAEKEKKIAQKRKERKNPGKPENFSEKIGRKKYSPEKEEKPEEKEPPGGIGKFSDRKTEKGDKKSGIFKRERRKKAGFPISFPIFLREKRHPAGCLIGFLDFSRCSGRKLLSPDFSGGVPFPGRKYSAKRIQRPSWSACCACPFPYRRESVPPWTPG